jgi:hypothetical protein
MRLKRAGDDARRSARCQLIHPGAEVAWWAVARRLKGEGASSSSVGMLHLTNGDSAAGTLRETGLSGTVMASRDVLHEGPVPAGFTLEGMSDVRARFLTEGQEGFRDVRADSPRSGRARRCAARGAARCALVRARSLRPTAAPADSRDARSAARNNGGVDRHRPVFLAWCPSTAWASSRRHSSPSSGRNAAASRARMGCLHRFCVPHSTVCSTNLRRCPRFSAEPNSSSSK